MHKRVLLPTDFSKNALNAIKYAIKLYEEQACDFYLLNVFGFSGYNLDKMMVPEPGEMAYEIAKDKSVEELNKIVQSLQLSSDPTQHTFHTISVFNSLLEAVGHAIKKHNIDIVVMGTKGKSGSSLRFFGSNTIEVMEKIITCPVIAVPDKNQFPVPREIVFPTDFMSSFKSKDLQYLLEITDLHKAAIRVLHIGPEAGLKKVQIENKALLETILQGTEHTFHFQKGEKVPKAIKDFMKSRESTMLAFVNRKHGFFEIIFTKPLIREVSYDSEFPILALHASAKN